MSVTSKIRLFEAQALVAPLHLVQVAASCIVTQLSVYRKKHENASVNWSWPSPAKSDWLSLPPSESVAEASDAHRFTDQKIILQMGTAPTKT